MIGRCYIWAWSFSKGMRQHALQCKSCHPGGLLPLSNMVIEMARENDMSHQLLPSNHLAMNYIHCWKQILYVLIYIYIYISIYHQWSTYLQMLIKPISRTLGVWASPGNFFSDFPGIFFSRIRSLYSKTHKARSSNHAERVRAPTFFQHGKVAIL